MTACSNLLCDNCRKPGACCEGFSLPVPPDVYTELEALVWLASVWTGVVNEKAVGMSPSVLGQAEHVQVGLPFLPVRTSDGSRWDFRCPLLGRDGRCTEYDTRPALCRDFKAGSDRLCIMSTEQSIRAMNPKHAALLDEHDAWGVLKRDGRAP